MNEISLKAKLLLERMRFAPRMYALRRESLMCYIAGIAEMSDLELDVAAFYKKHLGMKGSSYVGVDLPLEDDWARTVIDDLISMLP